MHDNGLIWCDTYAHCDNGACNPFELSDADVYRATSS